VGVCGHSDFYLPTLILGAPSFSITTTHVLLYTETCTKTGMVMIFGEISTAATVNYEQVCTLLLCRPLPPSHPPSLPSTFSPFPFPTTCHPSCDPLFLAQAFSHLSSVSPCLRDSVCTTPTHDSPLPPSLPPSLPPCPPLQVIRDTIKEIGYDDPGKGLDYNTMNVIVAIEEQSPDIAQSVDSRTGNVEDIGAGDQGIMFG